MVIVCSGDTRLINLISELFGNKNHIKQLLDTKRLKNLVSRPDDLLIIDLKRFKEDGIPVLTTPAVVLASVLDYGQAVRLLQKGVRAYGNRHMHRDNLVQAVNAARTGQVWLPPSLVTQMVASMSGPPAVDHTDETAFREPLSKREGEVAQLVAKGLSNKEVADTMCISVRTVKAHLTSIFSKTGFRDRLELAVKMKHHDDTPTPRPSLHSDQTHEAMSG